MVCQYRALPCAGARLTPAPAPPLARGGATLPPFNPKATSHATPLRPTPPLPHPPSAPPCPWHYPAPPCLHRLRCAGPCAGRSRGGLCPCPCPCPCGAAPCNCAALTQGTTPCACPVPRAGPVPPRPSTGLALATLPGAAPPPTFCHKPETLGKRKANRAQIRKTFVFFEEKCRASRDSRRGTLARAPQTCHDPFGFTGARMCLFGIVCEC